MNILKVNNLSVSYNRSAVIENVSFTVKKGEYLCLVGANGSGKSTLLKCLVGILPPASGRIECTVDKSKVSYLQQAVPADKAFPATVREIVCSGTQKFGKPPFYSKADRAAAQRAMELLGVAEIAGKRIGELSGGQQQRVMLARAMCRGPELLYLDEPCAGLDPEISEELYSLLHTLNKKDGVTVIMASHDLDEVEQYAERVIEIGKSTIEFDGSPADWLINH